MAALTGARLIWLRGRAGCSRRSRSKADRVRHLGVQALDRPASVMSIAGLATQHDALRSSSTLQQRSLVDLTDQRLHLLADASAARPLLGAWSSRSRC